MSDKVRIPHLRAAILALALVGAGVARAPAQDSVIVDEDLTINDPNLTREERIRRHKIKLQSILEEHRQKAKERQKERETARQKAIEEQKLELAKKLAEARVRTSGGPRKTPIGTAIRTTSAAGGKTPFRVSRALVYLYPFQVIAEVGRSVITDVRLYNTSGLPFNEIDLYLKYDPLVVAPERVNDATIYERLDGGPTLQVNSSKGTLYYSARLLETTRLSTMTLLTVRWRALNPILYSEIGFSLDDRDTRIGLNDGDILGHVAAGQREGGTLPAGISVVPRRNSPRKLMPRFSEIAIAGIDERVHLRLEAEPEAVAADQEWIVSLVLRNDATLPFNDLRLRILFDPAKLQVEDWHAGNWTRQGINIFDAFAHETFPFEVHRLNEADNERGEILYHVGTREARYFPSGEIAKIKFKALTDASLADVRFDFQETSRPADEIVTDVSFFGTSVLFAPEQPATKAAERPAPDPLRPPDT
jgi:hypothetical protein